MSSWSQSQYGGLYIYMGSIELFYRRWNCLLPAHWNGSRKREHIEDWKTIIQRCCSNIQVIELTKLLSRFSFGLTGLLSLSPLCSGARQACSGATQSFSCATQSCSVTFLFLSSLTNHCLTTHISCRVDFVNFRRWCPGNPFRIPRRSHSGSHQK